MYIHIHYIIETFSVVGSVPTLLNDPQKPLRHAILYIRLLKISLSSILRTHSLLTFSLNWSKLVGWDSWSCIFILHHTFSIGLRSGLWPWLTC